MDFRIGQTYRWDRPISFDLGLDALGLGLELDAGIGLEIGWSLDFGFGVSENDGFYFVTDYIDAGENPVDGAGQIVDKELSLKATVTLNSAGGGPATGRGHAGLPRG